MAASVLFIAQKLALMISSEADFLFGVHDQAQLLCSEISLMTSALQDAGEKGRTRKEVKEWLNQVRDAVMEAEDVIDLFILQAQRQRLHRNILTRYICYPTLLPDLHKLGTKIENSNKKINQLSARRSTLGLATSEEAGQSSVGMITNEQGLLFRRGDCIEDFYVIGFQKEENEIITKLLRHNVPPRLCQTVVSIVGMGGSGKTTLARKIYKRNDVKQHFQTHAWISVSQQYNIKDLLQVIIEQIQSLTYEEQQQLKVLNVESLIYRLKSCLKTTNYFLVFDDIWRPEDWDMFKQALPIQGEGYQSRVLVTTRNEAVARYADPATDPYFQRLLDEDESWKLFQTKVMGSKDAGCPEDLQDLGRKIVHKCHGLPLAIVILGGLLSMKSRTHIAWSKVLDSISWELHENERSCLKVLALSYTELPDHLKPCFLYVGLFPEDYEIKRCRLIWLWVAEGFIQRRGRLTMEDVAEDYMEELIQRSMIQATGRSYDGRVTSCRIHDLVRDLAISEAKPERFLEVLGSDNLNSSKKSRRLSIIEPSGGMYGTPTNALNQQGSTSTPNHLRTLLCFSVNIKRNRLMNSLSRAMKLLRVLDLEGIKSIPNSLLKHTGKLILLKFLSLRRTGIKNLPSSIGDLQNLQTLDLSLTAIKRLPRTIMKLKELRNLVFYNSYLIVNPNSIDFPLDHMMNLRTLVLHEGKWLKGRLHNLTNLRELGIVLSRNISPFKEPLLNAIPKLIQLRGLRIEFRKLGPGYNSAVSFPASFSDHLGLYHMNLDGVFGIRAFPSNLTSLSLSNFRAQEPGKMMAILKKLPKLRCLFLVRGCLNKFNFSVNGFTQLEELALSKIFDFESVTMEEGALPKLRVLSIVDHGLERIPCVLKQMVTLQELNLSLSSSTKELENRIQKDIGEDWEIIKHIPSIGIKTDWMYVMPYDFGQWC